MIEVLEPEDRLAAERARVDHTSSADSKVPDAPRRSSTARTGSPTRSTPTVARYGRLNPTSSRSRAHAPRDPGQRLLAAELERERLPPGSQPTPAVAPIPNRSNRHRLDRIREPELEPRAPRARARASRATRAGTTRACAPMPRSRCAGVRAAVPTSSRASPRARIDRSRRARSPRTHRSRPRPRRAVGDTAAVPTPSVDMTGPAPPVGTDHLAGAVRAQTPYRSGRRSCWVDLLRRGPTCAASARRPRSRSPSAPARVESRAGPRTGRSPTTARRSRAWTSGRAVRVAGELEVPRAAQVVGATNHDVARETIDVDGERVGVADHDLDPGRPRARERDEPRARGRDRSVIGAGRSAAQLASR